MNFQRELCDFSSEKYFFKIKSYVTIIKITFKLLMIWVDIYGNNLLRSVSVCRGGGDGCEFVFVLCLLTMDQNPRVTW